MDRARAFLQISQARPRGERREKGPLAAHLARKRDLERYLSRGRHGAEREGPLFNILTRLQEPVHEESSVGEHR